MRFSFVILTWNSSAYLASCLDALVDEIAGHGPGEMEAFVVDNGSRDGTVEVLQRYQRRFPDAVKLILLPENMGTTHPRNLALRKASGRFIAVIDSDLQLLPGALDRLAALLEELPDAGMVVPRLQYPDGRHQKSTDRFPTFLSKAYRYFWLRRMEKRETEEIRGNDPVEVEYAISAMWLFRREILDRVGLLDEHIFYSPEDVDYCLRIWKSGYKILLAPDAVCTHHAQEISRGFRVTPATIHHVKGMLYYFKKHRYFFKRPALGR